MAKVFNLPLAERNLPSVVTEQNLIKVKLLPEEVGTKVGWKRFIDGRPVGEKLKGTKRKRAESSDSEGDNEDGKATARPVIWVRLQLIPFSSTLHSHLYSPDCWYVPCFIFKAAFDTQGRALATYLLFIMHFSTCIISPTCRLNMQLYVYCDDFFSFLVEEGAAFLPGLCPLILTDFSNS